MPEHAAYKALLEMDTLRTSTYNRILRLKSGDVAPVPLGYGK